MIVGRRRRGRSRHPRHQRQSLRQLPAPSRVLLRLQPDPGCVDRAAVEVAAAGARASPVPGRLADAVLRLRGAARSRRPRPAACSTSTSTPSSRGRCAIPTSFRSTSTRAPRERLLRVPGLGTKTVKRVLSSRRFARLRLDDLARLGASLRRVMPWVQAADHHPRGLLDRPDRLRALVAPAPRAGLVVLRCGARRSTRRGASRPGGTRRAWPWSRRSNPMRSTGAMSTVACSRRAPSPMRPRCATRPVLAARSSTSPSTCSRIARTAGMRCCTGCSGASRTASAAFLNSRRTRTCGARACSKRR